MIALSTLIILFGELWLLIELGSVLGTLAVLAWLAGAIVLGLWLVRRQSRVIATGLARLDPSAGPRRGLFPFGPQGLAPGGAAPDGLAVAGLYDAVLVAVAGLALALPGLASDVLALTLMVPAVRRYVARRFFGAPIGRSRPSPFASGRAGKASSAARSKAPKVAPEEVEVIPPGLLPDPFQKRPKVIDVD